MPVRNSSAIFFAAAIASVVTSTADTWAALNEQPTNDAAAKPLDRSCYVHEADGLVRYYLEGPPRDGELPYLQGQPIIGADGGLVVRDEVPLSSIPLRILRAPPCPPGKHHLS